MEANDKCFEEYVKSNWSLFLAEQHKIFSKLHLLQHEYDKLKKDYAKELYKTELNYDVLMSKYNVLKLEYDKLKDELKQVRAHYDEHALEPLVNLTGGYVVLANEHAALKEKAEMMVALLQRASDKIDEIQTQANTGNGNYLRAEIDSFLSSYNSQTNNRNENDG